MKKGLDTDDVEDLDLWNQEDASDLERPDDLGKYEIIVSSRDWTVETIVRQIEQQNIDLDPAFQRRNAWRDPRRSRLIESFVLGFPVPQIVLAENPRHRGTFIVIDGKQRLLTLAGLLLPTYRDYWTQPKLTGLNVLKSLNRVALDAFLTAAEFARERRQLMNADMRTTVITGFRDEGVLYDIFYRINTGAVPLSSQELRQVLNRGQFAQYLLEVTGQSNSLWTVLGITGPDPRLRDVELLLRLIAWRRFSRDYRGNMKPFLDDTMDKLNKSWSTDGPAIERLARELLVGVETALGVLGDAAGRKPKDGGFERPLNRALFEVQAYYLSFPQVRDAATKRPKALAAALRQLSADPDFIGSIEATTKSIENYRTRFGKFRHALERSLKVDVPALQLGASRQ